ncbi:MAG TPA: RNA polymerase sigma factor [Oligoflexus sp.]|uniref:RNA polymerase sigma factor n=1 Tax=Oligoflexus sp. TaxID=1971216 RepID=UPI002D3FBBB9|nr:RNA polymerase sigma factor [Oligoflexus sp.]HYX33344.1 RNA polymerase sigma factor [Oligoflexus sp.]
MNQNKPSGGDFHRFYLNQVKALRGYFRRLGVSRPEQLDDLVQDTFLESYRCWDNLRCAKAARSWLFTIGRRQLARMIKKGRDLVLDSSDDEILTQAGYTPAQPEHELHAQRVCKIILRRLTQTESNTKRQALTAYFLEEKSFREIELDMKIKLSTLTTWCSRFRHECLISIEKDQAQSKPEPGRLKHLLKKGAKL